MNERKLVLFTSYFPYTNLESFLESEIQTVSKHFGSIEIIPCNVLTVEMVAQKRPIPENVSVRLDINAEINRLNGHRWIRILLTLLTMRALIALFREIKPILKSTNPKEALRQAISHLSISILIYRILRNEYYGDFDEIVFYSYWLYDSAFALGLLNQKYKISCATRAHGADLYIERKKLNYLPFHSQKIHLIGKVILISEDGYSYLQRLYGKNIKDKLFVSRLGVIGQLSATYHKAEQLRVISCAYLRSMKRIDLLSKAIARCNFPIKWIHIGDGEEREKIENICRSFSSTIEYEFIGNKPNSWVLDYYKNNEFDLFVNVSSYEGLPMSIMEAQSFGIPVLATDVGGNSELVNNENGYIVPMTIDEFGLASILFEFYHSSMQDIVLKRTNSYLTWKENSNAVTQYTNFAHLLLGL